MSFEAPPGPIEVIRRHPPLAAELARRFANVPIPAPDRAIITVQALNDLPADASITVEIRDDPVRSWAVDKRSVAVTLSPARDGEFHLHCRPVSELAEDPGEPTAVITRDSGPQLADGGPWLTLFAATIGAIDLATARGRDLVLGAVDATGSGPAGVCALTALVMRAADERARELLEDSMGTRRLFGKVFEMEKSEAYADGYARGLQRVPHRGHRLEGAGDPRPGRDPGAP